MALKHLVQPDEYTCLPTCFAMLLGMDVQTLLNDLGIDYKEIVRSDLPEPNNRRGIHVQELFIYCVIKHGVYCTLIENPMIIYRAIGVEDVIDQTKQIKFLSSMFTGIIIGEVNHKHHAVVYKDGVVYDPNGTRYKIDMFDVHGLILGNWMIP